MDKLLPMLPGLLISLVSLFLAWEARRHSRRRESDTDWQTKIDAVRDDLKPLAQSCRTSEADLLVLKKQMDVFWKGVSFSASQALHSPHRKDDLDPLIEKFQCDQIDDEELGEFKRLLYEIAEDESETSFHRKNARDVLTLIKIRYEISSEAIGA